MDRKSKKKKNRPDKSHKHMQRDVIEYHDVIMHAPLREVTWGQETLRPQELLNKHLLQNHVPLLVKVAKASVGENLVDVMPYGQVVLVKGWERQQRVVVRDQRRRLLSVPLHWPVKFRVRDNKLSKSKPKLLKEIVQEHRLPVRVYFDTLHKWKFHVGKREVTNFRFGSLEIREVYMEHFIIGMPITSNDIEQEARSMVTLPIYANVRFVVAQGFNDKSQEEFAELKSSYDRKVSDIEFTKLFGTEDAFQYQEEYLFFNKSITYHLSAGAPEDVGPAAGRLSKQDFGERGRLLPSMQRSLQAAGKQLDENQNVRVSVEIEDRSSSSDKGTTSNKVIEENGEEHGGANQTGNSTSNHVTPSDTDALYAQSTKVTVTKDTETTVETMETSTKAHAESESEVTEQPATTTTNECRNHTTIAAEPPVRDLRDIQTDPKLVDLRDIKPPPEITPKYGSNENLAHDEDAHFSAPWGFMGGGRYRSVVTVSHAGSDIVSDYEDDGSLVGRHAGGRKEYVIASRYGTVAGDAPSRRRKAYVTRSVHDLRPAADTHTSRSYSLKRVQGSGPMKYYVPDSPVRTYSVSSGSHRDPSPYRVTSLSSHRDTMSEVGVPTHRRHVTRHTLRTDIPEEYPFATRSGRVYSINDSFDDYDTVDGRPVDVYFRERQPRREKTRSLSARRPTDNYVGRPTQKSDPFVGRPSEKRDHFVGRPTEPRDNFVGRPSQEYNHFVGRPTEKRDNFVGRPSQEYDHFVGRPSNQVANQAPVRVLSLERGRARHRHIPDHDRSGYVIMNEHPTALNHREEKRMRRRTIQGPVQLTSHDNIQMTSHEPVQFTSSVVDVSTGEVMRRRSTTVAPSMGRERTQMEYNVRSKSLDRPNHMKSVPVAFSDTDDEMPRTTENRSRKSHNYRYTSLPVNPQHSDAGYLRSHGNAGENMYASEGIGFYQETVVRRDHPRTIEVLNHEHRNSDVYFDENDNAGITGHTQDSKQGSSGFVIESAFAGPISVDANLPSTSYVSMDNQMEMETHTMQNDENVTRVNVIPPPPPPAPPVPAIAHVSKSKPSSSQPSTSHHHTETTVKQHTGRAISSQEAEMQHELKSTVATRTNSAGSEKDSAIPSDMGSNPQSSIGGVQIRKKDVVAMTDKDYRANSLRQVITRHRASLENITDNELMSVAKTDSEFEGVLNANTRTSTSPEAHDTLKSSGYGSVSSKPEVHVTKSTTSSPYIKPLPSLTRAKHSHTNLDNPWLTDEIEQGSEGHLKVDSHGEGRHVRESIMSIHELDEYLRSQSIGVESDDETGKQYEGTQMGITDFELTHL